MTHRSDSERRKQRDQAIRSLDEQIADHLAWASRSGELQGAKGYGQPMKEPDGYAETPADLRMPFKILKNANVPPPEIALFHRRAELRRQLELASTEAERAATRRKLSELEQIIALRLEALSVKGRL